MSARLVTVVEALSGGLVVSCQALRGDPLDSVNSLVAMARSAEAGGAVGLRVAAPDVVSAVRQVCTVPIIGIKKHADRTRAYITPTVEDVRALTDAGADIVAVDATDLDRPGDISAVDYLRLLCRTFDVPVMADVSTKEEGERAFDAGAALVATTLSGYTPHSRPLDGPDLDLVHELSEIGRVVAEGRIHTPDQLAAAFEAGAFAVVVGRAITRPQDITARFEARTPRARAVRASSTSTTIDIESNPATVRPTASPATNLTVGPSAITYWLGVDGGQSGLRAMIVGSDGRIHGVGTGNPIGPVLAPAGRVALARSLESAIGEASAGGRVPIHAAFLSLSGAVGGGAIEQAVRDVASAIVPTENLFVDNDIVAAWAGALLLRPGMVAVSGSGSGVLGRDLAGHTVRGGGWGYLFGDQAGAIGIVREAITRALDSQDSATDDGGLGNDIATALGLPDIAAVPKAYYAGQLDRRRLATLAPDVTVAAEAGNSVARSVVSDAGRILGRQLRNAARRLDWQGSAVNWAGVGGVFDGCRPLVEAMDKELMSGSDLRFVRVERRSPPVLGAALLAAERSNTPPDLMAALATELSSRAVHT